MSFFAFQNNPKNLYPSYKMDLDLWNCLGRVKTRIIAKFRRTGLVIYATANFFARTATVKILAPTGAN